MNQTAILASIKRAAAAFILLWVEARPLGESDVADLLMIAPKTARRYLRCLATFELAERVHFHAGYVLTPKGAAFFQPGKNDQVEIEPGKNDRFEGQSGKCYRVPPIITIKDSIHDSNNESTKDKDIDSKSNNKPKPVKNTALELWERDEHADVVAELKRLGISPNGKTLQLLEMEHITPEYIRASHRALVEDGKASWIGQLINNMIAGMPAPELRDNGHTVDCHCEDCELPAHRAVSNHAYFTDPDYKPETESAQLEPDESIHTPFGGNGHTALETWLGAKHSLATKLEKVQYETWLEPAKLVAYIDDTLRVGLNNAYACNWLTEHVKADLEERLGATVEFIYPGSQEEYRWEAKEA
jgi:hypothetical protein